MAKVIPNKGNERNPCNTTVRDINAGIYNLDSDAFDAASDEELRELIQNLKTAREYAESVWEYRHKPPAEKCEHCGK